MIGNFVLSGVFQAILATVLSSFISLYLLPISYIINAPVVSLITLRKGSAFGIYILVVSFLLLQIFLYLVKLPFSYGVIYVLIMWLPVWISSGLLRYSQSQGVTLFVMGLLSIIMMIILYFFAEGVVVELKEIFYKSIEFLNKQDHLGKYYEQVVFLGDYIVGIFLSTYMLNTYVGVLLGRWWQSKLFNKGAFRIEFHSLRLPKMILPISLVILFFVLILQDYWRIFFVNVFFIISSMFFIQGISIAHKKLYKNKLSTLLLTLMYIMLFIFPVANIFIICMSIIDTIQNSLEKKQISN